MRPSQTGMPLLAGLVVAFLSFPASAAEEGKIPITTTSPAARESISYNALNSLNYALIRKWAAGMLHEGHR